VTDAVHWLETIGESRFFLWTHLYDPHRPYDPPEPYASIYGHSPYVGEIAFADSQIGRLLEVLEQRALLDRTIIVVAGDHGESLGERGERDHGVFIYENVLRVPLVVRAPTLAPYRVGAVVRLTDVMPTVLDLLDVPGPAVYGVSLVELMRGHRHDLNLEAYAESLYPARLGWSSLRALRDGRYKVIDAPRPELYDLARDPFEEQNLYGERGALAEAMTRRVRALDGAGPQAPGDGDAKPAVSADLRERLGALGYIASANRAPRHREDRPDPKDCIAFSNGWDDVSVLTAIAAVSRCG
jgi:arylsulfatase A-like enzyme